MNHDSGGDMRGAVATLHQSGECMAFFGCPTRRPSPEPLVEDRPAITDRLSQRHVGAVSQAPEVRHFEPETVFVGEVASRFFGALRGSGLSKAGLPGYRGDLGVSERFEQTIEPTHIRNCVVVQKGHKFRVAFGQASVACAAQSWGRFNNVTRAEPDRCTFCAGIAGCVVNNKDFAWTGVEAADGFKAIAQIVWAIAGTDDD